MNNQEHDLSTVSQEELSTLTKEGFECENSCGFYLDFKKYHDKGLGEDGTDRVETISLNLETKQWYSSAGHRDLDGNYWYEETFSNPDGTLKGAFADLEKDRQEAPKQLASDFYRRG